jgi:hypothetical protein
MLWNKTKFGHAKGNNPKILQLLDKFNLQYKSLTQNTKWDYDI